MTVNDRFIQQLNGTSFSVASMILAVRCCHLSDLIVASEPETTPIDTPHTLLPLALLAPPTRRPFSSLYIYAPSPPLEADASGAASMSRNSSGPWIRRATTVHRWLASLPVLHKIADIPDRTRAEDVKAARRTITRGLHQLSSVRSYAIPRILKDAFLMHL